MCAPILQGLVKQELSGSKRYEILAVRVSASSPLTPNTPLNYVNDLDIASDGTIYFTDSGGFSPVRNRAGFWDTMEAFLLIAFQVPPHGLLPGPTCLSVYWSVCWSVCLPVCCSVCWSVCLLVCWSPALHFVTMYGNC